MEAGVCHWGCEKGEWEWEWLLRMDVELSLFWKVWMNCCVGCREIMSEQDSLCFLVKKTSFFSLLVVDTYSCRT